MSMGEQNQQVADTKAAHELSILVREYVDGNHHRIQTTALLSAYVQAAIANPCCTARCLQQLGEAAFILIQALEANSAQGKSLH